MYLIFHQADYSLKPPTDHVSCHFKSYFDVTKWLYLSVWIVYLVFKMSLPINTIILLIQTDSRLREVAFITWMKQSQQNITSHIQSYHDGGIASSHMSFPHSFSITPKVFVLQFFLSSNILKRHCLSYLLGGNARSCRQNKIFMLMAYVICKTICRGYMYIFHSSR